jgi:hypothetical protein
MDLFLFLSFLSFAYPIPFEWWIERSNDIKMKPIFYEDECITSIVELNMNEYVECTWSWSRKHDKDHSRVTPFDNAQCNNKQPICWVYMMILHKSLVGHVDIIEKLLFIFGFWKKKLHNQISFRTRS